jgi:hypothetical protein
MASAVRVDKALFHRLPPAILPGWMRRLVEMFDLSPPGGPTARGGRVRSKFYYNKGMISQKLGETIVRALQGWLSGLSVFLCNSVLCGGFVWEHRALNRPKRPFPARADQGVWPTGVPGRARRRVVEPFRSLHGGPKPDQQGGEPHLGLSFHALPR